MSIRVSKNVLLRWAIEDIDRELSKLSDSVNVSDLKIEVDRLIVLLSDETDIFNCSKCEEYEETLREIHNLSY